MTIFNPEIPIYFKSRDPGIGFRDCKPYLRTYIYDPFLGGRAKSPIKRVASRPPSASTASSSVAPSPAPVHEVKSGPHIASSLQSQPASQQHQQPPNMQPQKRQRPSESSLKFVL